jgi:hypothetical protein
MRKKAPSYLITIPEPCHEGWHNMLPAEKGRYCQSCSKTVVDFSGMSDAEILEAIKQKPGSCGHFSRHQLNRPLEPYVVRQRQQAAGWPRALLMAVLSVFSWKHDATGAVKPTVAISRPWRAAQVQDKGPDTGKPKKIVFSGVVQDSNSLKNIPAEFVIYKNHKYTGKVSTDSAGKFNLVVENDTAITIMLYSRDYENKYMKVNQLHAHMVILMQPSEYFYEGDYNIDYIYKK